jgi:transposase-like protein
MTDATTALSEYLRKIGLSLDDDFVRQAVQYLMQQLIELEAEQHIGAGRYQRTPTRQTQRNGHRERGLDTRVGELSLRIPKVRQGTFFPSLLEPRRRTEKALLAVIQKAYVAGVSTRKVDDVVQAQGMTGVDRSSVSRICQGLDELVEAFRTRPLAGAYPYLWLDALYLKVRHALQAATASSARPWSLRLGCARRTGTKSWAWPWAPAKTPPSGANFCAAWSDAG